MTAKGHVETKGKRKIAVSLDDDVFEYINGIAKRNGCGFASIAASMLRAIMVDDRRFDKVDVL